MNKPGNATLIFLCVTSLVMAGMLQFWRQSSLVDQQVVLREQWYRQWYLADAGLALVLPLAKQQFSALLKQEAPEQPLPVIDPAYKLSWLAQPYKKKYVRLTVHVRGADGRSNQIRCLVDWQPLIGSHDKKPVFMVHHYTFGPCV